jgi:hypothetical protein
MIKWIKGLFNKHKLGVNNKEYFKNVGDALIYRNVYGNMCKYIIEESKYEDGMYLKVEK